MAGGEGQYIDVSLQEALITYYTDAHPALAWMQLGQNVTRVGATSNLVIPLGGVPQRGRVDFGGHHHAPGVGHAGGVDLRGDGKRGGAERRLPGREPGPGPPQRHHHRPGGGLHHPLHQRGAVPRGAAAQPGVHSGEHGVGPAGRPAAGGEQLLVRAGAPVHRQPPVSPGSVRQWRGVPGHGSPRPGWGRTTGRSTAGSWA